MFFSSRKVEDRLIYSNMKEPSGRLKPWVFEFLRRYGKQAVISMDGYRQRKRWKLPWRQ